MTISEAILAWLDENKKWFKIDIICKEADINKGNFSKFRKNGYIPEKHLESIMNIITPLGFSLDGLLIENNRPKNKKRILKERDAVTKFLDQNLLSKNEIETPAFKNEVEKMIWEEEQLLKLKK